MIYAKAVRRKEVTVKLLKVIEENFNSLTYSNALRFHFTMHYFHNFDSIQNGGG